MLCFVFVFLIVLSWNMDVVGKLDGVLVQRSRINGTTFGKLSIFAFFFFNFHCDSLNKIMLH